MYVGGPTHSHSLEEVYALRELQALRRLNPHQHIIELQDVILYDGHDDMTDPLASDDAHGGILTLAFELMDYNLYELLSRRRSQISDERIHTFMFQICKALEYIHRWVAACVASMS